MRLTHRQTDVLTKLHRSTHRRLTWIRLHNGIGRPRGTVDSLVARGLVVVFWLRKQKCVGLTESGLIEAAKSRAAFQRMLAGVR